MSDLSEERSVGANHTVAIPEYIAEEALAKAVDPPYYELPVCIAQIHPATTALADDVPLFRGANNTWFRGIIASNAIGTPINPDAIKDAKLAVKVLSMYQRSYPDIITDPVIETAKNRAHILRDTHASLELGPQPNINIFFHEQFQHLSSRLAKVEAQLGATIANTRILSRNRQYQDRRPLQKYIEGDGHDLALGVCGHAALPADAQNYHPGAAIGDLPHSWNPKVEEYELVDILQLIIYYKDDFGINPGDSVDVGRDKILSWLV